MVPAGENSDSRQIATLVSIPASTSNDPTPGFWSSLGEGLRESCRPPQHPQTVGPKNKHYGAVAIQLSVNPEAFQAGAGLSTAEPDLIEPRVLEINGTSQFLLGTIHAQWDPRQLPDMVHKAFAIGLTVNDIVNAEIPSPLERVAAKGASARAKWRKKRAVRRVPDLERAISDRKANHQKALTDAAATLAEPLDAGLARIDGSPSATSGIHHAHKIGTTGAEVARAEIARLATPAAAAAEVASSRTWLELARRRAQTAVVSLLGESVALFERFPVQIIRTVPEGGTPPAQARSSAASGSARGATTDRTDGRERGRSNKRPRC